VLSRGQFAILGEHRRIRRTPALSFGPLEWLPADALDDAYFRLLPSGQSTVTPEEAAVLAAPSGHIEMEH
jgi:hypothetical protein